MTSRAAPSDELGLTRTLAWGERVTYLPVRHHSPACAFHVDRVVRELRPDHVLIEGPRDATSLIPLLMDERTSFPVAIYTTFVERRGRGRRHHGAYYPLCDYSPELAAMRAAQAVRARVSFIDLTYPELVTAERASESSTAEEGVRSLQEEHYLEHSRRLAESCRRLRVRDADDLWDHLFESRYRTLPSRSFFEGVLTYCSMGRSDYDESLLRAEAHDVREAAMRREIDSVEGTVVVVTGGFHTVALPTTEARPAPVVKLRRSEDATTTLMRYGFVQLDALNGYSSGMKSPEFYQGVWEGRPPEATVVEIARALRREAGVPSTADAIAAVTQLENLARLRGHPQPTREDLLDSVRSVFVKGEIDVEGGLVLTRVRRFLTGDRIGIVSPDAGQPPIVRDFEAEAARLGFEVGLASDGGEKTLDLYRSVRHREASRFFHRLALLEVPFGTLVRGPDFVLGRETGRVQESWRYAWIPQTESALIEASRYGATIEEAAAHRLVVEFDRAVRGGGGSGDGAMLVLEAYRCGLHARAEVMIAQVALMIRRDVDFVSVVASLSQFTLLRFACEPLEAHDEVAVLAVARQAWYRAAYLLPTLADQRDGEERVLDALCSWREDEDHLSDGADPWSPGREARLDPLWGLFSNPKANPTLRGACAGLLFGDGELEPEALASSVAAILAASDASLGGRFIRGLMRACRSVCFRVSSIISILTERLGSMETGDFLLSLPHLRLAFSELTPREIDEVAKVVTEICGVDETRARPRAPSAARLTTREFSEDDLFAATRLESEVERWARESAWGGLFDVT